MKLPGQIEKWGAAILGAVALLLSANLVVRYRHLQAGIMHPAVKIPAHARAGSLAHPGPAWAKSKGPDELSRYDSIVAVDRLKEFDDRPLPELKRNPFEFVTAPAPPPRVRADGTPAAPAPQQPPPPPPVTLKVMGYSEGQGGVQEAMVSDEDQIYVVHPGDPVGTRYKVIKITPTVVTVEDATLHQAVDLPVPQ
jgi:hypothetical protein